MGQRLKRIILSIGILMGFAAPVLLPATAHGATFDLFKSCSGVDSEICKNQQDQKLFGPGSIWTRIINTIIFLVGAVAVIMIVIGGLRYTLSGGDSGSINNAKNTILYAIVGIVIAVSAYAIVNFVVTRI